MQRSTGEIVEWNIKKIQAKASHMQQRLKEISQRARCGQFDDIIDANLIVNSMDITMEQLEYDVDRLLSYFPNNVIGTGEKGAGLLSYFPNNVIGTGEKGAETARMLDFHSMSKSCNDLTSKKQLHQTMGFESREMKDSLAFKNAIKQIKTLEEIVLSGNLIKRIEKMEKEQTSSSRNILSHVENMEKNLLRDNLPHRVEVLEKKTVVEIHSRLGTLEAHDQETIKGVFGDVSGLGSCTPSVVSQLSSMENLLNEGKARIHVMEEKLNKIEPSEAQKAVPDIQGKIMIAAGDRPRYMEEVEEEDSENSSEESSSDGDVEFSVTLSHDGPWEDGAVIRSVEHVDVNDGEAFDVDRCLFVPPVDGLYRLSLKVDRKDNGFTEVEVWECGSDGGWNDSLLYVKLKEGVYRGRFKKDFSLQAGELLRLRVFGGTPFDSCIFGGQLLSE